MTRAIGDIVPVETIFNQPGIGYTSVNAVLTRDLPIVQFAFAVIAVLVISATFAVDVLSARIEPVSQLISR